MGPLPPTRRRHHEWTNPLGRAGRLGRFLGRVVTQRADLVEVIRVNGAGHVLAIEAGTVEMFDRLIAFLDCSNKIFQVLIDQPVGSDDLTVARPPWVIFGQILDLGPFGRNLAEIALPRVPRGSPSERK